MASEPESFTVFIPELERLIAEVMEEWKVGASRCCAQLPSDFATSDLEAAHRRPTLFGVVGSSSTIFAFEPSEIGAGRMDLLTQAPRSGLGMPRRPS
jgi:hypothetical protein